MNREQIVREFLSGELTQEQVAGKYGVNDSTVRGWAVKLCPEDYQAMLERNGRIGRVRKQRAQELNESVESVVNLLLEGLSLQRACKQLGLSYEAMRVRVKAQYPELIQPCKKRLIPEYVKRTAVRDYLGGVSLAVVAETYGVSSSSVLRWAYEFAA